MKRLHRVAAYLASARPWPLLGAACIVQLVVAIAVAFSSTHNHFVWYSGGDATEYWTSSWSLAHGGIGQTHIGYGVPVLWAWVPLVAGATLVTGLPVITLIQLLVFVPLAAVLVWAIGDLLFGRLFAWWALLLWIVGPVLVLWGFHSDVAPEFQNLFLAPHWYGMTDMGDMPATLAVLAATWATLRLLNGRHLGDAVLGGLFTGVAVGVKPSAGFFIPAVAVLLIATRDLRAIGAWIAATIPSLLSLILWKDKGLGQLPILALQRTREAVGSHPLLAVSNPYVHFDLGHLEGELRDLGNLFWSLRLLEFLFFAGLLGALRRSPLKGAFLGVWCAGFVILKGSTSLASVTSLSYFRLVEPGLPAFVLLAASVVFLVPRRGQAFAPGHRPAALPGGRRTVGAAVALFALVPLVLLIATPTASAVRYAWDNERGNDAPISNSLTATSIGSGDAVHLSWRPFKGNATFVYYLVYRGSTATTCLVPGAGGQECDLQMTVVGITAKTSYVDHPGPGRHWYRIGLAANYQSSTDGSDLMLVGPVTAATTAR